MRIGVDLDDVLAELLIGLDKYHNEIYKTNFSLEDHIDFDLSKIWKCSKEEMKKRVYDFYDSDFVIREVKPLEGAVEVIDKLSKEHDLVLITSRPEFLKQRTIDWLEKYFPSKFNKVFFTSQFAEKNVLKTKGDLCLELGINLMIEDCFEYAMDCASKNVDVLLVDRPHNQIGDLPEKIRRVKNWEEIYLIIKEKI